MIQPRYRRDSEFEIWFEIWCDFDGLLELAKALGFAICRSVNEYSDAQRYVEVPEPELADMWRRLSAAPFSFASEQLWQAHYLVAQPGRHRRDTDLAAVISPDWLYRRRWYFTLGLHWRSPLSPAALELVEAVFAGARP